MKVLARGGLRLQTAIEAVIASEMLAYDPDGARAKAGEDTVQWRLRHAGYDAPARDESEYLTRELESGRSVALAQKQVTQFTRALERLIERQDSVHGLTPDGARAVLGAYAIAQENYGLLRDQVRAFEQFEHDVAAPVEAVDYRQEALPS